LRENPKIQFFIHPLGAPFVADPSLEDANRRQNLPPHMAARFAKMEPVPQDRINHLRDGDVFDLGNGEKLRIHFAPGHQPSGVVLFAEKNGGFLSTTWWEIVLLIATFSSYSTRRVLISGRL